MSEAHSDQETARSMNLNEAGRRVLQCLYERYSEVAKLNWFTSAPDPIFDKTGLSIPDRKRALQHLVTKGLSAYRGGGGEYFVFNERGVNVAENPAALDAILPTVSDARRIAERAQQLRSKFLLLLYQTVNGNIQQQMYLSELAQQLGIYENDARSIAILLHKQGYVRHNGILIHMTAEGAAAVADALTSGEDDDSEPTTQRNARPDESVQVLKETLHSFMTFSQSLLRIIDRDLDELAIAVSCGQHKTTLLLCGSVLEAILIEVLSLRADLAQSYSKRKKFPDEASLEDLVSIATQEGFLSDTANQYGNSIKDHRDLIHPHSEVRNNIEVDQVTAQAMVHLVRLVVRDLHKAKETGRFTAYQNK